MTITQKLAAGFSVAPWQAENSAALLDEGNTLPFIARYRKEKRSFIGCFAICIAKEAYGSLLNAS